MIYAYTYHTYIYRCYYDSLINIIIVIIINPHLGLINPLR